MKYIEYIKILHMEKRRKKRIYIRAKKSKFYDYFILWYF